MPFNWKKSYMNEQIIIHYRAILPNDELQRGQLNW